MTSNKPEIHFTAKESKLNLTKAEIAFITLFMSLAIITLGTIIWLIDTAPDCWDKYHTEQSAITYCEHHG